MTTYQIMSPWLVTDDPGLPTFDPVDGEDDPVPPDDGPVTVPAQPDDPEDEDA